MSVSSSHTITNETSDNRYSNKVKALYSPAGCMLLLAFVSPSRPVVLSHSIKKHQPCLFNSIRSTRKHRLGLAL